jgi:hypothetical protein
MLPVDSFFRSPNPPSTRERRLYEATHTGLPHRCFWRTFGLTAGGTEMVACGHAVGMPGPVGGFCT